MAVPALCLVQYFTGNQYHTVRGQRMGMCYVAFPV